MNIKTILLVLAIIFLIVGVSVFLVWKKNKEYQDFLVGLQNYQSPPSLSERFVLGASTAGENFSAEVQAVDLMIGELEKEYVEHKKRFSTEL